jgi:hypothetical protein
MWAKIIATLTGQTVEAVLNYQTAKRTLKANIELERLKGKAEYERAKSQRASESEGYDHQWEMESIKNSGWKDEWVLVVLSIPMVLSFIPATVGYVQQGFVVLESTPVWYRVVVASVYLATFGLRLWRRDVNKGTNVIEEIK